MSTIQSSDCSLSLQLKIVECISPIHTVSSLYISGTSLSSSSSKQVPRGEKGDLGAEKFKPQVSDFPGLYKLWRGRVL